MTLDSGSIGTGGPKDMTSLIEARRLLSEGRVAEAGRICEAVLEHSPDDEEALGVAALASLRGGRPSRAIELLERATKVNPGNPVSLHHLGRAQELVGDLPSALASLAEALRLKPDSYLSRLHYASLLERSGDREASAMHFGRALRDAQSIGKWVDAASTPAGLRPLVEHAVVTVRTTGRAVLLGVMGDLAERYGRGAMTRVERFLSFHLRDEKPTFPDARQRPTFLYFPDLPASPYFDRTLFPWMASMEDQTTAIREELRLLLGSATGRERVFQNDDVERQNLRGTDTEPSWTGYYFYRHGVRRDQNCAACPVTAAALDAVPLCRVDNHAPEVLFSVFTAGTHLLPHRGVTNTRIVGHLPLIVPDDCALSVGGDIHVWREGEIVVFDDTYEHEAWNRSRDIRVVLIFDLWNPYLTEAERSAVAELVQTIEGMQQSMEGL